MAYPIQLLPSGIIFHAETKESILHAALSAGLNVNHGCTNGRCGLCKVRLIEGQVAQLRHQDFVLSEAEKLTGNILMCCNTARSALSLEGSVASDGSDIPLQELTTSIRRIDHLDSNTLSLHLRTPRSNTLRFMAGQHARLQLDNGLQREVPIASCPCDGLHLEFHLNREASDPFTDYMFSAAGRKTSVRISGPCNGITLVEKDPSPILFIAWGSGFAPVRSLLENCLSLEFNQAIAFHWVVHEHEHHYADSYCRSIADAIDNFSYYPVKTDTATEAIDEIIAKHESFAGWRSYLFAPPAIIDTVIDRLTAVGLPEEKIKSDPIVA